MAKFNTGTLRAAVSSPITSETVPSGVTFEGAPGYARDTRSELFLLAVTNMVGEKTFYETAAQRDSRYAQLVRTATNQDPEWTAGFLGWLRGDGNMRSASLVGAAQFVKARLDAGEAGMSRQVVNSVLQRADEPGEMLGYWTSTFGKAVPKPVKRGVADAVNRLYTEKSLLKYDAEGRGFRFGDVLELVHPTTDQEWRGELYRHAIDRRHKRDNPIPEQLGLLRKRAALMALPVEQRRAVITSDDASVVLFEAGMTWESLAGWLQGPMDGLAWESVIPSMGYMARLRNLRNFDEAKVSDEVAQDVANYLSDPGQVAKSRQLPMRFLSAYRAAPSLRWSWPLEQAINLSLGNVPALKGRTLILVDTSTSMEAGMSDKSGLQRWDAAALFGAALASRCTNVDLVSFSSAQMYYHDPVGGKTKQFPLRKGESLLASVKRWQDEGYFLRGGTNTGAALQQHFAGHDRVVILTDEQATGQDVGQLIPQSTPLYTVNLAGYTHGHAPSGLGNRHTLGGLSDATFRWIPLLEAGASATWPF